MSVGNSQFQLHGVGFNFSSTSYDWLVVNRNMTNAQYKGWGTVIGEGSYQFMIWAGDGSPDTFRIKIWWEAGDGEHILYDNGVQQPIDGCRIVIHK